MTLAPNFPLASSFLHDQSWCSNDVVFPTNGFGCQTGIRHHVEEQFGNLHNPFVDGLKNHTRYIYKTNKANYLEKFHLSSLLTWAIFRSQTMSATSSIDVLPIGLSTTSFLGLATFWGPFLSSRTLRSIGVVVHEVDPCPIRNTCQGFPIHSKTIFIFQRVVQTPSNPLYPSFFPNNELSSSIW